MKAYITVGISGSGKSSWAENFNPCIHTKVDVVNINRDDTRWFLTGKRGWNGPNAYKFYSKTEKEVTSVNINKITVAASYGADIIISDTNLNTTTRKKLIDICELHGYEVIIKEFPISFQEACRRDKERGIYAVGEEVLKKQWEMWVAYHADKQDGMWESQSE